MRLQSKTSSHEKGAAMRSVLRSVRKRKKVRRLGEVNVIDRQAYAGFDLDGKVEAIRALVPLGLMRTRRTDGAMGATRAP
jgi:hypothetical protein